MNRSNLVAALVLTICGATIARGASPPAKHATAFIGHRGASADAPENTLAAFKLCYDQGAEGSELDLRSTKDHQLIVIHDTTTTRVAGVDKKVSNQTFEDLRKLEVGQWGQWSGKGFSAKLPTLEEALATIPDGRKMYLDSKCAESELPHVRDAVARSGKKAEQIVVICFNLVHCKQYKSLLPQCKVYWLVAHKEDAPPIEALMQEARSAGLDGLDLQSSFPIDAAFVDKVHAAGLELHIWTVDDAAASLQLVAAGVDSITTNRPGWLRKQALSEQARSGGNR